MEKASTPTAHITTAQISNKLDKLKLSNKPKKLHIDILGTQPKPKPITQIKAQEQTANEKLNNMSISQLSIQSDVSPEEQKQKVKSEKTKLSWWDIKKIREIGSGADGIVWLINFGSNPKWFALKVVRLSSDPKRQEQLKNEAKVSSCVKDHHIIKCYASYEYDGTYNFVLEYMNKGTLRDILEKVKKIKENLLGNIISQVMKGLLYFQKKHGTKIMHRDLKLTNIWLNSKGYAKIADFGISAIGEASSMEKSTWIGTSMYMSPERMQLQDYKLNSDIWSIGIITFECLVGVHPFHYNKPEKHLGGNFEILNAIESFSFPQWDKNEYSEEAIDFINKCLIKDKNIRPYAINWTEHPWWKRYENGRSDLEMFLKQM